jgi:hypothetical protein
MVDYSCMSADREWSRLNDNNRHARIERVAWWRTKKKFKQFIKDVKCLFGYHDWNDGKEDCQWDGSYHFKCKNCYHRKGKPRNYDGYKYVTGKFEENYRNED